MTHPFADRCCRDLLVSCCSAAAALSGRERWRTLLVVTINQRVHYRMCLPLSRHDQPPSLIVVSEVWMSCNALHSMVSCQDMLKDRFISTSQLQ